MAGLLDFLFDNQGQGTLPPTNPVLDQARKGPFGDYDLGSHVLIASQFMDNNPGAAVAAMQAMNQRRVARDEQRRMQFAIGKILAKRPDLADRAEADPEAFVKYYYSSMDDADKRKMDLQAKLDEERRAEARKLDEEKRLFAHQDASQQAGFAHQDQSQAAQFGHEDTTRQQALQNDPAYQFRQGMGGMLKEGMEDLQAPGAGERPGALPPEVLTMRAKTGIPDLTLPETLQLSSAIMAGPENYQQVLQKLYEIRNLKPEASPAFQQNYDRSLKDPAFAKAWEEDKANDNKGITVTTPDGTTYQIGGSKSGGGGGSNDTEAARRSQLLGKTIPPAVKKADDGWNELVDNEKNLYAIAAENNLPAVIGNIAGSKLYTSDKAQAAAQGIRITGQMFLYQVSGAQQSPEEVVRVINEDIMPAPGDGKEKLELKKQTRQAMVQAMQYLAGDDSERILVRDEVRNAQKQLGRPLRAEEYLQIVDRVHVNNYGEGIPSEQTPGQPEEEPLDDVIKRGLGG